MDIIYKNAKVDLDSTNATTVLTVGSTTKKEAAIIKSVLVSEYSNNADTITLTITNTNGSLIQEESLSHPVDNLTWNTDDYKLTGTLNEKLARIGLMVAPICMKYLIDQIHQQILEPYHALHKSAN